MEEMEEVVQDKIYLLFGVALRLIGRYRDHLSQLENLYKMVEKAEIDGDGPENYDHNGGFADFGCQMQRSIDAVSEGLEAEVRAIRVNMLLESTRQSIRRELAARFDIKCFSEELEGCLVLPIEFTQLRNMEKFIRGVFNCEISAALETVVLMAFLKSVKKFYQKKIDEEDLDQAIKILRDIFNRFLALGISIPLQDIKDMNKSLKVRLHIDIVKKSDFADQEKSLKRQSELRDACQEILEQQSSNGSSIRIVEALLFNLSPSISETPAVSEEKAEQATGSSANGTKAATVDASLHRSPALIPAPNPDTFLGQVDLDKENERIITKAMDRIVGCAKQLMHRFEDDTYKYNKILDILAEYKRRANANEPVVLESRDEHVYAKPPFDRFRQVIEKGVREVQEKQGPYANGRARRLLQTAWDRLHE